MYTQSSLRASDVLFQENKAQHGGAVYVLFAYNTFFSNATFVNNTAAVGGAVHFYGLGTERIHQSVLLDNKAADYGGAIYVLFNGEYTKLNLSDSTIRRNTATIGGAQEQNQIDFSENWLLLSF